VSEPLWRLLLSHPSDLSCEECFAVTEFYAGLLAERGPEILPEVLRHLQGCPVCPAEQDQALERLASAYGDGNGEMNKR
jgi:hypothetical protein